MWRFLEVLPRKASKALSQFGYVRPKHNCKFKSSSIEDFAMLVFKVTANLRGLILGLVAHDEQKGHIYIISKTSTCYHRQQQKRKYSRNCHILERRSWSILLPAHSDSRNISVEEAITTGTPLSHDHWLPRTASGWKHAWPPRRTHSRLGKIEPRSGTLNLSPKIAPQLMGFAGEVYLPVD